MINVAIVEDQPADTRALQDALRRYEAETGEKIEITCYETADRFLINYKADHDVVFMDIEMPGMDGLTAAKRLRDIDENVFLIFVTNVARYAINGYKVNALDYFLKPILYRDLKMRMDRVVRLMVDNGKTLMLSTQDGMRRVPLNTITYIESGDHVLLYHTEKDTYSVRGKNMRTVEQELESSGFFRCNSGYLVNLRHVQAVDGNCVTVGNSQLLISRPRRKAFLEALIRNFRG